jgi:hypothetical protein
MRLGLIGPAHDGDDALERAVQFLSKQEGVQRAIYLGVDQALDRVVSTLAERLVNDNPGDAFVWPRAADRCADGDPGEIDAFIRAERERLSLMVFSALPSEETRLVELLSGKVAVMIYDKARLDEDDIASATLIVFGKSPEPLIKPIGSRWFLSPGPLDAYGIMLLEDSDEGIKLTLFDNDCNVVRSDRLLSMQSMLPQAMR